MHFENGFLDERSFQDFSPLLVACQAYASHTRFSFKASDFNDLQNDSASDTSTEQIKARLRAAPTVSDLAARLKSAVSAKSEGKATLEQEALLNQLDQAFNIVIGEIARGIIKATCVGLSMFPPSQPPAGIDDNDCYYEDVSAPLPVIAQRLYNEEQMRDNLCLGDDLRLRSATASFILDFAEQSGISLPQISEKYRTMLVQFQTCVAEWVNGNANDEHGDESACRRATSIMPIEKIEVALRKDLVVLPSCWTLASSTVRDGIALLLGM